VSALKIESSEAGRFERLVGYEIFGGHNLIGEWVRVVIFEPLDDSVTLERISVTSDDWVVHDFKSNRAIEMLQ
jgi:hypothetical protein